MPNPRKARPDASLCHCTQLRKASRHVSQLYDDALTDSGLKTTQRAILAQLRRHQPTSVGELADALVMDAGGLAHTLKPLTREKLIAIEVDPLDRRHRLLRLTAQGMRRLAQSDALWESAQRRFEKSVGSGSASKLAELMHLLVDGGFTKAFESNQ